MDEALQSIARAFARNREAMPLLELGIFVLLAITVALQLGGLARRWLRRRADFQELAAARGLAGGEVALVVELARHAGARPVELLTQLDQFERATAAALATPEALRATATASADGELEPAPGLAARIRRLRQALGFDRLPDHAPLLSSRELAPGAEVEVAGLPGQACEVGESTFTVALREPAAAAVGALVSLATVHAREARYTLRCRLLEAQPWRAGHWRLVFAHDEAPVRIQQREYARVAARGPLVLRPLATWPGRPSPRRDLRVELLDVSGGGALVSCREGLAVGTLAGASFLVGDVHFGNLRAVVLSAERGPDGGWRIHVEFGPMGEAERDRLVAAVERLELARRGARAGGE